MRSPVAPVKLSGSCCGDEGGFISELHGQTYGLKANQLRRLRNLYKRRIPRHGVISQDFARRIAEISFETGRQVGVLVNRRGSIEFVIVGNALRIELPDFKRVRGGPGRLRGLRCIHTHLRGEDLTRDDLTDLALLRLDAMLAIKVDDAGLPGLTCLASLRPPGQPGASVEIHPPRPPSLFDFDFLEWIEALEDRFAARAAGLELGGASERAVLVGVELGVDRFAEERLAEMHELARSAGVEIIDVVTQRRGRPDPRYLIGKGKLEDLVVRAWQQGADLVLFDQDLTPTQVRHITDLIETRIVDRTQLILDIFAQHARTREGQLQVELAQLRYRLPRLAGHGESLSRLAGGIGGRGPGETKLEVDRRRVRERIRWLERQVQTIRRRRETRRARRRRQLLPIISIVGYTNAGKSTLLNRLTHSHVDTASRLFATLDSSSRRLRFPRERDVIITDTVGFIRDLPPDLIAGFHSTLEEIQDADVLLHVVDASRSDVESQIAAVRHTLEGLGLANKPETLVLNKCDRLDRSDVQRLVARLEGIPISATTGDGIEAMLYPLEALLFPGPAPGEGRIAAGGR